VQPEKSKKQESFNRHAVLAPLLFLILFVLFIYGSLLVAVLGASAWVIDVYDLAFFARLGIVGVWLLAAGALAFWLGGSFLVALIPYYILQSRGRYILADNVRLYIIIVLMGIFISPLILWRNVRHNHPDLRRRYRQKLKRLAKGKKMQQRLSERQHR